MFSRLRQKVTRRVLVGVGLGVILAAGAAAGWLVDGATSVGAAASSAPNTYGAPPCAPNTPASMIPSCENGPTVNTRQWPIVPAAGQSAISQSRADQIGSAMVAKSAGATRGTDTVSPRANSEMMTYQQANHLLGDGANPSVDPSTKVWVVTVDAPFALYMTPSANEPPPPSVFTVILDAANGAPIDACAGCSVVG